MKVILRDTVLIIFFRGKYQEFDDKRIVAKLEDAKSKHTVLMIYDSLDYFAKVHKWKNTQTESQRTMDARNARNAF